MARILIVDDAEQNLLLYQLYLKGDEFEVVTARGGREALETISKQEFDLVLLDVVMPEMGGIEVCRRLKATPRTASIPVIFFTGRLRDEADKQVAYEVGAVDYLTKPVDKQELTARIRVMLRFRKERASLERKNARLADAVRKGTALVATIGEQLEDYRGLLEAHGRTGEGTIILDRDRVVVGVSPAAARMFPELQEGVPFDDRGGKLSNLDGALAEWDGAAVETRVVELKEQGDPPLRVTIQTTRGAAPLLVLRVVDVSEEDRINKRIADRYPDDLQGRIRQMTHEGRGAYRISKFVGRAPALRELTEQVDKLRQSRCTALIVGESGSGKELIASALHYDGPFGSRPFTPIHCGAISPELIESELFGYEKGAFTGAGDRKIGLFAASDGGTIFLDEIAETSMDLQVKLLRVLQLGEVRPVGATRPRHVDVRIIAATNADLAEMVREGRFREDLYYRLDVVTLHLPSLRERKEDLPELVFHFLKRFNETYSRTDTPVTDVTRGAMRAMHAYDWPGNVRELENTIDRAFALGVGATLREEDLPARIRDPQRRGPIPEIRSAAAPIPIGPRAGVSSMRDKKRDYERRMVVEMLERCGGNKAEACKRLHMAKSTFYRKLKELDIEPFGAADAGGGA